MALRETALQFGKPSACCDKRDLDKLHRSAHVLRHGLLARARRFVMANRDRCLVMQYGSDTTPLITKERYEHEVSDVKVVRGARSCNEFLIQRVFLEGQPGDSLAVVEAPIPMASKTAFAHFGAARALLKSPREWGHQGLLVEFHKYDRALKSACGRLHRQMHLALEDKADEDLHPGLSYRLYLTHWQFCEGCFAHDCHNGLKWSVLNFTRDKDCMRSSYLVHESLRHGYGLLVRHAGAWVRSVLGFSDWRNHEMKQFYESLDVDEAFRGMIIAPARFDRSPLARFDRSSCQSSIARMVPLPLGPSGLRIPHQGSIFHSPPPTPLSFPRKVWGPASITLSSLCSWFRSSGLDRGLLRLGDPFRERQATRCD